MADGYLGLLLPPGPAGEPEAGTVLQSLAEWSDNHTVDEVLAAQGIDHGVACHLVRRGSVVVTPAALLHPAVPQPAGSLVYELLTGPPEREVGELVFVADLIRELRAWPKTPGPRSTWDPDQVAWAVVGCWRDGEITGLQVDDLSF